MTRLRLLRFRIRSIMLLIATVACVLALAQWVPGIVILFWVFPVSLLAERLFGEPPSAADGRGSSFRATRSLAVFLLCAALCAVASWCGISSGVPTMLTPLPLFSIVPYFALGDTGLWWSIPLIPIGTFVLLNFYQLRVTGPSPLPTRFAFLLGLVTAFSACWFVGGWGYGVQYQGLLFTLDSAVINVVFLLVLWSWWFAVRRRASKAAALRFATLLHCWLFWFAFPYLGELP
jgi:hypothetical protein